MDISNTVVLIGKENCGKSQLIASMTDKQAVPDNLEGSTVKCETYSFGGCKYVDTPGIVLASDTETTRLALQELEHSDNVLLVAKASSIDEDLNDLLPLTEGKKVSIVITFWDDAQKQGYRHKEIHKLHDKLRIPIDTVDARHMSAKTCEHIHHHLESSIPCPHCFSKIKSNIVIPPTQNYLNTGLFVALISAVLLFCPTIAAIWVANRFAGILEMHVMAFLKPLVELFEPFPELLKSLLVGSYGLLTMGPLLLVWAIPTVFLYALFLAIYKSSGLMNQITINLHPLMVHFGLSGRDLVRVIMGFGCNVPAVTMTRACSQCSRRNTISAIGFTSACSYQMGASLAVFAAIQAPFLGLYYVLALVVCGLIYLRLTVSRASRQDQKFLIGHKTPLRLPSGESVTRETYQIIHEFLVKALPIFLCISLVASLVDHFGWFEHMGLWLGPALSIFSLPPEAALPVFMASVRKDGILLFLNTDLLNQLTTYQVFLGVFMAGTLLPCLVTVFTIARECSKLFALQIMGKQLVASLGFTFILSQFPYFFQLFF